MDELYQIFGVDKNASLEKLTEKRRALLIATESDAVEGGPAFGADFWLVNEAWEILSDSKKRALYNDNGNDYFNLPEDGLARVVSIAQKHLQTDRTPYASDASLHRVRETIKRLVRLSKVKVCVL